MTLQDKVIGVALILSFFFGFIIGGLINGIFVERLCADHHVGTLDTKWWRKAVSSAKFRKAEDLSHGK